MGSDHEQEDQRPVKLLTPSDIREKFRGERGLGKPPSERLIRQLIRESGCYRKIGRALVLTEDDFLGFLAHIGCGRERSTSALPHPARQTEVRREAATTPEAKAAEEARRFEEKVQQAVDAANELDRQPLPVEPEARRAFIAAKRRARMRANKGVRKLFEREQAREGKSADTEVVMFPSRESGPQAGHERGPTPREALDELTRERRRELRALRRRIFDGIPDQPAGDQPGTFRGKWHRD